ncbi:MAG: hypothetical protein JRI23_22270 [Deltaproteobacteria bacterium]|jgi:hypothetical protein|nr:hypothetical protein [Deltaproteobacteria bacterium]MBW2534672.1 hypothetical protein [Deltaproteobacteria bacterium]
MDPTSGRVGPESRPRQESLSIGLAVLVHLGAALVLDFVVPAPAHQPATAAAPQPIDALVDVTLEPAPTPVGVALPVPHGRSTATELQRRASRRDHAPSGVLVPGDAALVEPGALVAPGDPRDPGSGLTPGDADPGAGPAVPPAAGSPSADGYGPPPLVGLVPGAGGPSLWSLPGIMPPDHAPAAPTTIPRRRYDRDAAGKVLRSELRRRDAELGMLPPAATAAASALRVAVRSHTPAVSNGTFQARFDASGRIVSLQVLSFSAGNVQQWQRAARQARASLAGQTFAMRGDFARGALVTVHTRSVMQYPSGNGRKPVKKRPEDPSAWPFTPKDPPAGRSFRTPPWGPPPDEALARGDVSDIGARKHRVVYASAEAQPL